VWWIWRLEAQNYRKLPDNCGFRDAAGFMRGDEVRGTDYTGHRFAWIVGRAGEPIVARHSDFQGVAQKTKQRYNLHEHPCAPSTAAFLMLAVTPNQLQYLSAR